MKLGGYPQPVDTEVGGFFAMSENILAVAPMTPIAFIKKWKLASLTERQAAQEHFIDLCSLFGHPTPSESDPDGIRFAFEKGAAKVGGGRGFADVWKKDHFAWEYKRKHGNLDAALQQLIRYAPALESPPLQVVCDIERIRIHTAWTNTVPATYEITLDDFADAGQREILRSVFFDPERLKPEKTRAAITTEAADKFSEIADRLRERGTAEDIAHFVNQLVFCFFAHSVRLLPEGLFSKLLQRASQRPERARKYLNDLFAAMEIGGEYDLSDIAHFNGGLFDGRRALPLEKDDIALLVAASDLDWGLIDPSIFGTLFERFLDPDKRAQIGAHYTDQEKIAKLIEPVILRPLREEWGTAKTEIESLLAGQKTPPMLAKKRRRMTHQEAAEEVRSRYLERLRKLQILDPACGSGNFLYLALQGVKDLENKANLECEAMGLPSRMLFVGPEILHGIEVNPLAAELARTTIWISDIQWRLRNGIHTKPRPILRKLDAIECRDALLTADSTPAAALGFVEYREAEWPKAEFIVGNPPFLGNKAMIGTLGQEYTERLRTVYAGRLSGGVDLVCYWFERARMEVTTIDRASSVGMVATQSIRKGENRKVIERIQKDATIFEAWSDEPWTVDGANVRVSLIGFAREYQGMVRLDGRIVPAIHADLSGGDSDLTTARRLHENSGLCFQGPVKVGPFDVSGDIARKWLALPLNANSQPNAVVVRPLVNALDIMRRPTDTWIVDFADLEESEAAFFAEPFGHVVREVKPLREKNRRGRRAEKWWQHGETVPGLRRALSHLARYVATPRVAKHRVFVWLDKSVLPDSRVYAIAREDDMAFGILHSRFHEAWALAQGSRHGDGDEGGRPTYNNQTCFETFPFPFELTPDQPPSRSLRNSHAQAIGKAARELVAARDRWLYPDDLVMWKPQLASGLPRKAMPRSEEAAASLKRRTLTALYNSRGTPEGTWLDRLHQRLDDAVAAAYGWPSDISDEDALANLLKLNLSRAAASASQKSQTMTPAEARRSPQFRLPISGGEQLTQRAAKPNAQSKPLEGRRPTTKRRVA
jgi:type II restriction/modification system DNA methylase subunit YeeA